MLGMFRLLHKELYGLHRAAKLGHKVVNVKGTAVVLMPQPRGTSGKVQTALDDTIDKEDLLEKADATDDSADERLCTKFADLAQKTISSTAAAATGSTLEEMLAAARANPQKPQPKKRGKAKAKSQGLEKVDPVWDGGIIGSDSDDLPELPPAATVPEEAAAAPLHSTAPGRGRGRGVARCGRGRGAKLDAAIADEPAADAPAGLDLNLDCAPPASRRKTNRGHPKITGDMHSASASIFALAQRPARS